MRFVALSLLLCAAAAAQDDSRFEKLAKQFIDKLLESVPERATTLGDHRFDSRIQDYSKAELERVSRTNAEYLTRLRKISPERLSAANRIDWRILESALEAAIWRTAVLREHEWNPMVYNPGYAIYPLLERDFAPLPRRLEAVRLRLESIPNRVAQAKANLNNASRIHAETAILQNKGTISLIREVVSKYADETPGGRARMGPAQDKAIAALEDWGAFLQKDVMPKASRDFRIGPERYAEKLRFALSSKLPADEIRTRAENDLLKTQAVMFETALPLYNEYFGRVPPEADRKRVIRLVLDKLAEQRPDAATIVDDATRELAEATAFVTQKNLVTVYNPPLKILEMPEFQRGVSVASCASPGPLDPGGVTFFNISPPPSNWTAAQVDSYFREYNNFMLKDLTVHEAMPGHYLEQAHANRFKAPTLIRSVFRSFLFAEGWGVYAERIMVEAGYGGPQVRMQQLKMRLRMIINAIIDQGIHARGMTEQQAMDLMLNDGFQENSEAAGKWRRACLTSAQLSTYYVGSTELDQLRTDYIKKFGEIQDWRAFHDKILSFGSPAPQYVRLSMGL